MIICNTDPSDKPCKHWVLFFFNDDESVDFYDSLGKDIKYYGSEFYDFVNKFAKSWYSCVERTQPLVHHYVDNIACIMLLVKLSHVPWGKL